MKEAVLSAEMARRVLFVLAAVVTIVAIMALGDLPGLLAIEEAHAGWRRP
jgi:hypothetical protein